MAGAGEPAIEVMVDTSGKKKGGYILIVEGAIPTAKGGIHGVVGEKDGKPMTMKSWVETLAKDALAVIALGSCAAFGGIPAAYPNPTQCRSVGEFFKPKASSTPLVNIPGCPPHPDWFVGTVATSCFPVCRSRRIWMSIGVLRLSMGKPSTRTVQGEPTMMKISLPKNSAIPGAIMN